MWLLVIIRLGLGYLVNIRLTIKAPVAQFVRLAHALEDNTIQVKRYWEKCKAKFRYF
jgi:hypothetical protein